MDIGCSNGGILSIFKDNGIKDCKGIDLGGEYVDFGRERGLDLERCSSKDLINRFRKRYDLIILNHVLEHFLDIPNELKIIRELMSDEGFLYIGVPGIKYIQQDWYGGDVLKYLQNAHIRHFTSGTLNQVMEWNGYTKLSGNEKIQSLFIKGKYEKKIKNFCGDVWNSILRDEEEYTTQSKNIRFEGGLSDKYFDIMMILNDWLTLYQKSQTIKSYFYNRSVKKVGIYGMGILGKQLYAELRGSDIEVCFIMDQRELDDYEVPVFKPKDNFPIVDMIIITTVDEYTDIRRTIEKNNIEIVPLAEIIFSMKYLSK